MIVLSALLKTCYEFNATSIFYEGFLSAVLLGGAFLHNASSSFFSTKYVESTSWANVIVVI